MITPSVLGLGVVLCAAVASYAVSRDRYCGISPQHTMCQYQGVGPACAELQERKVSREEARVIIAAHNRLRARVAGGLERRGQDAQPAAANMKELIWDDELARLAQRLADQCVYQHDCFDCRTVDRFRVGQNVALGFSTLAEGKADWRWAVNLWYNEVDEFDPQSIQPFEFSEDTGHYTQLLWADTSRVGCGYTMFLQNDWWAKLYVCNYGPAGNTAGGRMYAVGEPCSQCPAGTGCSGRQTPLCAGGGGSGGDSATSDDSSRSSGTGDPLSRLSGGDLSAPTGQSTSSQGDQSDQPFPENQDDEPSNDQGDRPFPEIQGDQAVDDQGDQPYPDRQGGPTIPDSHDGQSFTDAQGGQTSSNQNRPSFPGDQGIQSYPSNHGGQPSNNQASQSLPDNRNSKSSSNSQDVKPYSDIFNYFLSDKYGAPSYSNNQGDQALPNNGGSPFTGNQDGQPFNKQNSQSFPGNQGSQPYSGNQGRQPFKDQGGQSFPGSMLYLNKQMDTKFYPDILMEHLFFGRHGRKFYSKNLKDRPSFDKQDRQPNLEKQSRKFLNYGGRSFSNNQGGPFLSNRPLAESDFGSHGGKFSDNLVAQSQNQGSQPSYHQGSHPYYNEQDRKPYSDSPEAQYPDNQGEQFSNNQIRSKLYFGSQGDKSYFDNQASQSYNDNQGAKFYEQDGQSPDKVNQFYDNQGGQSSYQPSEPNGSNIKDLFSGLFGNGSWTLTIKSSDNKDSQSPSDDQESQSHSSSQIDQSYLGNQESPSYPGSQGVQSWSPILKSGEFSQPAIHGAKDLLSRLFGGFSSVLNDHSSDEGDQYDSTTRAASPTPTGVESPTPTITAESPIPTTKAENPDPTTRITGPPTIRKTNPAKPTKASPRPRHRPTTRATSPPTAKTIAPSTTASTVKPTPEPEVPSPAPGSQSMQSRSDNRSRQHQASNESDQSKSGQQRKQTLSGNQGSQSSANNQTEASNSDNEGSQPQQGGSSSRPNTLLKCDFDTEACNLKLSGAAWLRLNVGGLRRHIILSNVRAGEATNLQFSDAIQPPAEGDACIRFSYLKYQVSGNHTAELEIRLASEDRQDDRLRWQIAADARDRMKTMMADATGLKQPVKLHFALSVPGSADGQVTRVVLDDVQVTEGRCQQ